MAAVRGQQFHEKTPKEREKSENEAGEGGKMAKFLAVLVRRGHCEGERGSGGGAVPGEEGLGKRKNRGLKPTPFGKRKPNPF